MSFYRKGNKYNNTSCVCLIGKHWHQSRGEAGHCDYLSAQVQNKEIKSFEKQVKYYLCIGKAQITTHVVDFVVTGNDGSVWVEEYKGFATEIWGIKKRLFEALYPHIPYHVKR